MEPDYITIRRVSGMNAVTGEIDPVRWLALDETNGIQGSDCGGWGDSAQESLAALLEKNDPPSQTPSSAPSTE